jgi:nicotinamidase/pyrazinamidase
MTKEALIVVDVQNDFLPGGALGVPDGDHVVPVCRRLTSNPRFAEIVLTRDCHPPGHVSFASTHDLEPFTVHPETGLMLWPDHCVEGTYGAELADGLPGQLRHTGWIQQKGFEIDQDHFSIFGQDPEFADALRTQGVGKVTVVGLATELCVRQPALDAFEAGFETQVIESGCRAVTQIQGIRTFLELRNKGITVVR